MCGSCYTAMFKLRADFPGLQIFEFKPYVDIPGAGIGGASAPFILHAPGSQKALQVVPIFHLQFDSP